jgi:hypothetical protein
VTDFIARTFVVAFVLVYVVFFAALLAWNFRNWLAVRFRKGVLARLRTHLPQLHFSHHHRFFR